MRNDEYRNFKINNINFPASNRFTDILIHKTCIKRNNKENEEAVDEANYLGISPYNLNNDTLVLFENSFGGTTIEIATGGIPGYRDFAAAERFGNDRIGDVISERFKLVHFNYEEMRRIFNTNQSLMLYEVHYPIAVNGASSLPVREKVRINTTLITDINDRGVSLRGVPCPPGWDPGRVATSVVIEEYCRNQNISDDELLSLINEKLKSIGFDLEVKDIARIKE